MIQASPGSTGGDPCNQTLVIVSEPVVLNNVKSLGFK
jgi:hypothetical protein